MNKVRPVIDKFVELARSNIEDPNTRRRNDGKQWIVDDFPDYRNSTKPVIGVHKVSSSHNPQSIGSTTYNTIADIQASIFVDRTDRYDFDGDGSVEPAEDLVDYLHDQVKNIPEEYMDEFRSIDEVMYLVPVGSDTVRPESQDFILEAVTFEVRTFEQ